MCWGASLCSIELLEDVLGQTDSSVVWCVGMNVVRSEPQSLYYCQGYTVYIAPNCRGLAFSKILPKQFSQTKDSVRYSKISRSLIFEVRCQPRKTRNLWASKIRRYTVCSVVQEGGIEIGGLLCWRRLTSHKQPCTELPHFLFSVHHMVELANRYVSIRTHMTCCVQTCILSRSVLIVHTYIVDETDLGLNPLTMANEPDTIVLTQPPPPPPRPSHS